MSDYWEDTIALLQPPSGQQLVTKPTLKPDLLQKVPFKFLHDVITAVRVLANNVIDNVVRLQPWLCKLCACCMAGWKPR